MRRNVFTFVAFKNHSQTAALINALRDPESGKLRSWTQFRKRALEISEDYNKNWLRAEYNTAISSAQMANKWLGYEATKHILPYLQYKTQEDSKVRASHQALNNVTKKLEDSFWDEFYPPNGWNCRCYTLQQMEGDGKDPERYPTTKETPPAFRHNPGKTGQVFNEHHPYFDVPDKRHTKVKNAMVNIASEDFRMDARSALIGKSFQKDHLNIRLTGKSLKRVLRKPHKDRQIRLDVLRKFQDYLSDAKLIGSTQEMKGRGRYLKWYYYMVELDGVPCYLNIVELANGEHRLLAITDSIKK